jgi:isopentenyldiphosphate isomerase
VVARDIILEIEEAEMSEVKWFDPQGLKDEVEAHPELFTPGLQQVVNDICR